MLPRCLWVNEFSLNSSLRGLYMVQRTNAHRVHTRLRLTPCLMTYFLTNLIQIYYVVLNETVSNENVVSTNESLTARNFFKTFRT